MSDRDNLAALKARLPTGDAELDEWLTAAIRAEESARELKEALGASREPRDMTRVQQALARRDEAFARLAALQQRFDREMRGIIDNMR